jgi:hypothetical protein
LKQNKKLLCKLSEKKQKISQFFASAHEKKAKWLSFPFIALRGEIFLQNRRTPNIREHKKLCDIFTHNPEKMHHLDTGNCFQQEKGAIQFQASSDLNKHI